MTSAINSTFLSNIDATYPVAGSNNSSQPFRDNYAQIKSGLQIAGQELTRLQAKQISIVGDGTGTSGILGNTTSQPDAITLTLASTGVTAGTYTTVGNMNIAFTVDVKGRLTNVTSTPVTTRPEIVGTYAGAAVTTTSTLGYVKSLTLPSLTFDTYGTLTAATNVSTTLNFGITDHPLTQGSLLVGNSSNVASEFVVPSITYNSADVYVLAWRPGDTDYNLSWFKLPETPDASSAVLESVVAGSGITVSTDIYNPVINFDITKFTAYPDASTLDSTSLLLMRNTPDNTDYTVAISRIFELMPEDPLGTPLYNLVEDLTPELGGDLDLNNKIIFSKDNNGVTFEVYDSSPFKIVRVNTIDDTTDPPSELTEENYTRTTHTFPVVPPTFTDDDTSAGITSAYMKSYADGTMFWSNEAESTGGVTSILPGSGISFDVNGPIVDTGTINIDISNLTYKSPDLYADTALARDYTNALYQYSLSKATWTLPNVKFVDPVNTLNEFGVSGYGQMHSPYASIQGAIDSIDETDLVTLNYIYLMPGTYEEPIIDINKPNVYLISMLGPESTLIRGGIELSSGLTKTVLKGIHFNIDGLNNEIEDSSDIPSNILNVASGVDSLIADDCWFIGPIDSTTSRFPVIIKLEGTHVKEVSFNNCTLRGIVVNNLTFANTSLDLEDSWVRFTNIKGNRSYQFSIQTGAGSATDVCNVNIMRQAVHNGGILSLKNISLIAGEYTDAELEAILNSTDDITVPRTGIISTANASTSPHNMLILSNVGLKRIYGIDSILEPVKINKTGTCEYSFNNVDRTPSMDTITGNRMMYGGAVGVDIAETTKTVTLTGNYTLNVSQSRTWDMTLNADSTITLAEDIYAVNTTGYSVNAYANSLTVLIRQGTGGSNSVTFTAPGSILWSDGVGQPTNSSGVGKVSLYTFIRVGSTWMGSRSFNQV
jgi:hypothetical protein